MRQTDHPCSTDDVQNVHDLWLTYGTYASNGRCTEHSCFTVDEQDMPAPWKMVITYMKYVVVAYNSDIDPMDDPFHPFTPDEWSQPTSTMLRTYLIQNISDPRGPESVPSGPISSSRPTGYSPAAIELMGF